jgi:3-deoxy-7-phosphoheptulonate synthase
MLGGPMIVVMDEGAAEAAVEAVISRLMGAGCNVHRSSGAARTILGVVGAVSDEERAVIGEMPSVSKVVAVTPPYRLASRQFREHPSIVEGDWGRIGGERPWVAIEPVGLPDPLPGEPRPPSLPYVVASGRPFDAAVVRSAEAPDPVGALAALTLHPRPRDARWPVIFIHRDPTWGPDEWLRATERELSRGTPHVVLLEAGGRPPGGQRTFEITALARTRAATHLPIVVDVPSIAGRASECGAIACAAIACGAHGVVLRANFAVGDGGPRAPVAMAWDEAVAVAERVRALGEALR